MTVRFVLVAEGTSDEGLMPLLRDLCVRCGAEAAIGVAPDFRRLSRAPARDIRSRIEAALILEPSARLGFVHRDAGSRVETARLAEIGHAATGVAVGVVPVIPVRQTEAWLLLDEAAIRAVAENPNGDQDLNLPPAARVERIADPKQALRAALQRASGLRGRHAQRFEKDFGRHRAMLLSRLTLDGPLREVPAWRRLVERTGQALRETARSASV